MHIYALGAVQSEWQSSRLFLYEHISAVIVSRFSVFYYWWQISFVKSGLVIRPHAAEISFNRSDPANYNQYTQQLHDLLQSE